MNACIRLNIKRVGFIGINLGSGKYLDHKLKESGCTMHLDQNNTIVNRPETFTLNENELKYIVSSTQNKISQLSQIKEFGTPDEALANHKKIMELMQVLEAFYINKTWTA